jgi:hypothetical protein
MEALTIGGLIAFILVMAAPVVAFVWALMDLRRRPHAVKAVIKIAICIIVLSHASSTSSIEIVFAVLGIVVGALGARDMALLWRRRG